MAQNENKKQCCCSKEEKSAPALISIHSWVSFGHVGHGMAAFVLMRLKNRVTMLPCVLYSSSLSYPNAKGGPLDPQFVNDLAEGIENLPEFKENQVIYTGFLGRPEVAQATLRLRKSLEEARQEKITYFCDPVLGDRGYLYLPEEMVDVYRNQLLPEADVIMPNRFELGWLAGVEAPETVEAGEKAIDIILDKYEGLKGVVATGLVEKEDPAQLFIVMKERKDGGAVSFSKAVPHYADRHFAGAGDLLSASFVGLANHGMSYAPALEKAIDITTKVITKTNESGKYELRVIEMQDIFDN